MSAWSDPELRRLGDAVELQVSSRLSDGTLRPFVTIWGVRVGDGIYVRSAYGADNPWFRRAGASGRGRIRAAGLERDVTFHTPGREVHARIDAAYRDKYNQYGPQIVGTVVGDHAADATLRLNPDQP